MADENSHFIVKKAKMLEAQRLSRKEVTETNQRVGRLDSHMERLAINLNAFVEIHCISHQQHEERLRRLEDAVFGKGI